MSTLTKSRKKTQFNPSEIKDGRLKVPAAALRFGAEVQFADQPAEAQGDVIPVSILARSGNALQHWWFGKCIHDLTGMQPASAKLPFDYCHDDREVLGFSDSQEVTDDGLVMHGALLPFKDGDRVDEIVSKANRGAEWQASIYFDADNLVLEYVPDGMSVDVNGQTFDGPGVVFRQWVLRGAAICPYGYDSQTSVQFSNQGDELAVSVQEPLMATKPKKTALSKPAPNRHDRRKAASLAKGSKPKTAPAAGALTKSKTKLEASEEDDDDEDVAEASAEEMDDDPEADSEAEDACECAGEEGCECDEKDDEEDPVEMDDDEAGKQKAAKLATRKEAQRFVTAFGASLGGKWFAQGLTFEQAQSKFNAALLQQNKKLKSRVGELSAQVTALGGEEEPVSFTPADEKPGKAAPARVAKFSGHLPAGAAKFAASLKLPK